MIAQPDEGARAGDAVQRGRWRYLKNSLLVSTMTVVLGSTTRS
jgi:hypothetical protein